MSHDLCKAFLSADIPIKKLENPVLREVLQTHLSITLPRDSYFCKKYVPEVFKKVMDEIKADLSRGSDCARDAMGREVAHVLVGKLEANKYAKPYVVHVEFLEKADGDAMARSASYDNKNIIFALI